jgi:hypothetical protein
MLSRRLLVAVPATALLGLAAVPAVGSAATIAATTPCTTHVPLYKYASNPDPFPTTIAVTGGTPGARFLVAASDPKRGFDGSKGSQSGTFDAAGNGSVVIDAITLPYRNSDDLLAPSAGRDINLSVQDYGRGGAVIATGSTKVTNLSAEVVTKGRSPRSSLPIRASGAMFAGQKLTAFVVRGTKGSKVIKRYSLGTGNVCGYVSSKKAFARGRSNGSYSVYVQPGSKLDKSKPYAVSGFRVYTRRF